MRWAAAPAFFALIWATGAQAQVSIVEWGKDREPHSAKQHAALVAQLRARPQDALLHFQHGEMLARRYRQRQTADWRNAAAAYEFAVQLDPSLSAARAALGKLYADVGRHGQATQLLAEHVAISSGDMDAMSALAISALRSGDITLAVWAARNISGPEAGAAALHAAAIATGAAGLPDADRLLDRLRNIDAAAADAAARDIGFWRQGARLVDSSAPPAAPPAGDGLAAEPSRAAEDWRGCDTRAGESSQSYSSNVLGGSTSQPIGPQALAPLPAPCAGEPDPRMAMIEAVIIRQRDEQFDTRGINLLSALEIVARGRLRIEEEVADGGIAQNNNFLTLALPDAGINYLLNILDDQTTRADVLARPSLVALDRTPSLFFSGATITVPIAGQYSGSLQEKAIGVSLAVTPTFIDDDNLLLAVSAGRSFLEEGIDAELDNGIQTTTNSVTASVRMRFGETLVLSGLMESEEGLDRTKVPVLGDIPLVGMLFNNSSRQVLRNQVIVLLTPRRPNEQRSLYDDSLLPLRYDRRLAQAVSAMARRETPEAAMLDSLGQGLRRAGIIDRLPITDIAGVGVAD